MDAKKLNNISVTEYLKLEEDAQTKYEFHDGTIYAMSGGTVEHGLISGNLFAELKFALRSKNNNCTALNSEIKLHIQSLNKYVYPDVMVVCGDIERATEEPNSVTNPSIIIEVLSNSTEAYDRGDKFFSYQQISSLKEYILVDQYKAQVEIYTRQAQLWSIQRITGIEENVEIIPLGISIPMQHIYENVSFSTPI